MKKRLFALVLSLALLLSVTAFPALAAEENAVSANAKASIGAMTLYVGCGDAELTLKNWDWNAEVRVFKSSNPSVIAIENGVDSFPSIIPKKAGKAMITVKYRLNGTTYTMKKTFTVLKYPKAIKTVTINGKKIALKDEQKVKYYYDGINKKIAMTINLKPNSGWSISKIKAYTYDYGDEDTHKALTVKNNKKFYVPVDRDAVVTYVLKNKAGTKFQYTVYVFHIGE